MKPKPYWLAGVLIAASGLAAIASFEVFAGWPESLPKQPSMYVIQGFLDRAPQGTKIADRIDLVHSGYARRPLLVTYYGTPGETPLDLYLSRSMSSRYSLNGADADVQRVMKAPVGTRIDGTFVAYTSGSPSLLIADLQSPSDEKKASGAEPWPPSPSGLPTSSRPD